MTRIFAACLAAAAAPPPVLGGSDQVSEPIPVVSFVAPEYTEMATKARLAGTTSFEVSVASDGTVTSVVRVGEPLPMGLDRQAERAARQWRFAPALSSERKAALTFDFQVYDFCEPERPAAERLGPYHLRVQARGPRGGKYVMSSFQGGGSECRFEPRICPGEDPSIVAEPANP